MQFDENSHLHADLVGWHSNIHGFDNFKLLGSHNVPGGPAVVFMVEQQKENHSKKQH